MNTPEQSHRKWLKAEDEHLLTMNRRAMPLALMALRLGTTEVEIQSRLDFLAAEADAIKDREAQVIAAKLEASQPVQIDAFTVLGTKISKGYEVLGNDFEALVTLITSHITPEELETIIQAYLEKVGPAAMAGVDAKHLAHALCRAFAIIPRVMLQVQQAQPKVLQQDATANPAPAV